MLYQSRSPLEDSPGQQVKPIRQQADGPGRVLNIKTKTTLLSAAIATTIFLAGCSDSNNVGDDPGSSNQGIENGDNNGEGNGNGEANTTRGLTGFENSEAFETTLKEALRNHYANNGFTGDSDLAAIEIAVDAPAAPQAAPEVAASQESAADAGSNATSGDGSSDSNFTDTNVQEAGVDEADRVKSDGRYLYILGNTQFGQFGLPEAPVVDLPVITFDTAEVDNTTDFAVDAVADSSFYYEPTIARLRILEMNPDAADATLLHETSIELGGQSVDGMYLHGANRDALIFTSTSHGGGYWDYWGYSSFWGTTNSSIHRLSVEDRNSPQVVESANFDGQIISSRVVGDHMYLATRYFPVVEGVDFNDPNVSLDAAIESINVDLVMPSYQLSDGSSVPLASAENCFVSSLPENGYYLPDIITLAAVNLNDLTISDSVCYLGSVETLYVSTDTAVLANTFYDYSNNPGQPMPVDVAVEPVPTDAPDTPDSPDLIAEEEPLEERPIPVDPEEIPVIDFAPFSAARTDIHQFSFENGQLAYTGSGRVEGYVSGSTQQRSFRFSQANDHLRVVTENDLGFSFGGTEEFQSRAEFSPVFVSVLRPDGAGGLDVVAKLPNDAQPAHIGKPGERLHASRFLGDKGYLVTFRQTDPLYVIDFSDPGNPTVAGELEIEGYSDYLHPVGENHLLGLGRGAIPDLNGFGDGRGAFATGIKVSLFDVSNPAAPFEVQSLEVGRRGSNSEALFDHHGITFRAGQDGQPGRLAFGIDVNDLPSGDNFSPVPFFNWRETGLHTFEVHTGDNPGINLVGRLIVESTSPQNPWGPQAYGDRSLLVNDAVFYIHGDQVYGAQWGAVESFNGPR